MSAGLAAGTAGTPVPDTLNFGRFGEVRLLHPAGEARDVVLFFSGEHGWDAQAARVAARLAAEHAWVAGIDTRYFLAQMEKSADKCIALPVETENLSHYVQARAGVGHYLQPTLAGDATGAALAYATLAAAPANLFKGALSLGFCPSLRTHKPLCKGQGPGVERRSADELQLLPAANLGGRWIVLPRSGGSADPPAIAAAPGAGAASFLNACGAGDRQFVQQVPGAEWQDPAAGSAASAGSGAGIDEVLAAFRRVVAPGQLRRAALPAPLADLPLVEVAAQPGAYRQWFAVFLSGDGGWVGVDRGVAAELARRGVPVVGWDSLRYFWSPRTPQGAAADLQRVLQYYARHWNKPNALVLGYSQGADTLPFMLNRLPAATRAMVGFTALVAMSEPAYFEFPAEHWLGHEAGGISILPEVRDWVRQPYLCLYGAKESDSLCPQFEQQGHALRLPGGHHFGGEFAEIAEQILRRLPAY